jgi:hypothetical protein
MGIKNWMERFILIVNEGCVRDSSGNPTLFLRGLQRIARPRPLKDEGTPKIKLTIYGFYELKKDCQNNSLNLFIYTYKVKKTLQEIKE